ncbi:MAG TPA: adenylate/guanylate cyclase domain-containing protein [Frankiaceae bacterium]|nr:adenylate/guanylate cyclase domain-containing protein [Frankiaceae bacterium]
MAGDEHDAMLAETAEAILGPARYTREQAAEAAGVPHERATRLWRAMGFPEVSYDEVLFTEQDVAALRTAESLRANGVVDEDGLVALARSMAQALSRLAVSHAAIAGEYMLRTAAGDVDTETAMHQAESLVPEVGELLSFVWRRHLVAAAETTLVTLLGDTSPDAPVVVGFADLAGFTEASRNLDAAALDALVERFEANATHLVTGRGGRVVKTLGDEVLFTVDDVRAGVGIALDLAENADTLGGEVRVGAAYGPVLARLGDVFGPTVNLASRLTGIAHPGTVLVDREAAQALRDDAAYDVSPIARRSVRGYAHLAPFRVRRATRN